MSRYRDINVVGGDFSEEKWPDVEAMCQEVEDSGFIVVKILNYKDGPTKLIARVGNSVLITAARNAAEQKGWQVQAPYYAHGRLEGFKLSKTGTPRTGNAWA